MISITVQESYEFGVADSKKHRFKVADSTFKIES